MVKGNPRTARAHGEGPRPHIHHDATFAPSRGRIALERHRRALDPAWSSRTAPSRPRICSRIAPIIETLTSASARSSAPSTPSPSSNLRSALDDGAALDATARLEHARERAADLRPQNREPLQEIVETNFNLYTRITDDPTSTRPQEPPLRRLAPPPPPAGRAAESTRAEDPRVQVEPAPEPEGRPHRRPARDPRRPQPVAAFLNTEGAEFLTGVTDDPTVRRINRDRLKSDGKFLRQLAQAVRNALGYRAAPSIEPQTQFAEGKTVCLLSCQRSLEPVYLRRKRLPEGPRGRSLRAAWSGHTTPRYESVPEYVRTRFRSRPRGPTRATGPGWGLGSRHVGRRRARRVVLWDTHRGPSLFTRPADVKPVFVREGLHESAGTLRARTTPRRVDKR